MGNEKLSKKYKENRVRFSVQVFIVGIVLSATFFLLLLDNFKTYRSTVTILVSEKSEVAAKQQNQIISNIMEIPHTLAFYERLLKYNPDLSDQTVGNTPDQRKQMWNNILDVRQVGGNSSLIEISVTAPQEDDADNLASKTTRTLLDTVSQYYNIKTDVDMRIIDGPISQPVVTDWFWILPLSIALGGMLALMLQSFFDTLWQLLTGRFDGLENKSFFDFGKSDSAATKDGIDSFERLYQEDQQEPSLFSTEKDTVIAPEKDVISETTTDKNLQSHEMDALNKIIQQDTYPNFPEMPVHATPKTNAPDNLPIGDDFFYHQPEEAGTDKIEQGEEIETSQPEQKKEEKTHEPTPEELKKRLNQLLKGEL